jgi:transcriptional regulator with XRE-family HTH domain
MKGFTYKSYNFIDKDPIIDEIRSIYQDSGANYQYIHQHSGVAAGTISNWFNGQTKRPQAATINAVLRCLGYKLGVVPHESVVRIEPPMAQPKPRSETRHVVQMAKYKGARR